MKLDKKITKLLVEHELASVFEELVRQVGLPKILVQVSNRLVFKADKSQPDYKKWLKRAKTVHAVMDEIVGDVNV